MRKALCVGIDCYEKINDLHGCVNDANAVKEVLQRNGDGTLNFDVKLLTATSEASYISRSTLKDSVEELFIIRRRSCWSNMIQVQSLRIFERTGISL